MTVTVPRRLLHVLLVEDNPADVRLTVETMRECRLPVNLSVTGDGLALACLRAAPGSDAVRPDLILRDLNLPRMDGREVLAALKADEQLRCIPVVVLTTSTAEQDIFESYNLQANCSIAKPVALEQLIMVVRAINDYWFTTVTRPPFDARMTDEQPNARPAR